MDKFNNQFSTQKLRQETSMTSAGATFTPGTGEQMAPRATKKVLKKKLKPEVKDVEPKYAAGKAKVYMKDKWGWKDAPSIPNRPSKGGFIYKQLFEELKEAYTETNLDIILDDITSHIQTSSALDTGFKEWALKEMDILQDYMNKENWIESLNILEDINDAIQQENEIEWSEVYQDMFEKAIRRVEFLAQDQEDDDELNIVGEINENYSKFKTETKTRGKSDQFHQAIREVRKKVQEINRLFEYVSRLKAELSEGEGGLQYKMHTEKALSKIKEMVAELNQNVKKFK